MILSQMLNRLSRMKKQRYGKCNTIIIGRFAGKDNAFLIQNAFPILAKYFDHVHTIENKPITIHKKLDRELTINLREVLALHKRGIHLIFPDIEKIQEKMEEEFNEILYLFFDCPYKHYTFKHFEI